MSDGKDKKDDTKSIKDLSTWGEDNPFDGLGGFDVSDREVMAELTGMDKLELKTRLEKLYRKGWYGSSKPSGNLYMPADINAFRNFLQASKIQKIPWREAFKSMDKAPDLQLGKARPKKPASTDLREILQRTSLETIGKKLDDAAVKRLVKSYQGVYTDESKAESAPGAESFFKRRIESQYGVESKSYKYLNAISNVSNILEGL
jgi:hypothetical protein